MSFCLFCWLLISKPCLALLVTAHSVFVMGSIWCSLHNEIPLHLGQYSLWRLILHEPTFRASHTFKHMHQCRHTRYKHIPIHYLTKSHPPPPKSGRMKEDNFAYNKHTPTKRGHLAVLPCRQGKPWKASWLWSSRSRVICWEEGSSRFGCADN